MAAFTHAARKPSLQIMSLETILSQYSDIQLWREPVKRIRSILDSQMPDIVVPTPYGFNNYFVNNEFLATLENILQSSADPKELVLEASKRPQMRNQAPSFMIEPIDQIVSRYTLLREGFGTGPIIEHMSEIYRNLEEKLPDLLVNIDSPFRRAEFFVNHQLLLALSDILEEFPSTDFY